MIEGILGLFILFCIFVVMLKLGIGIIKVLLCLTIGIIGIVVLPFLLIPFIIIGGIVAVLVVFLKLIF